MKAAIDAERKLTLETASDIFATFIINPGYNQNVFVVDEAIKETEQDKAAREQFDLINISTDIMDVIEKGITKRQSWISSRVSQIEELKRKAHQMLDVINSNKDFSNKMKDLKDIKSQVYCVVQSGAQKFY